MSKVRVYEIAKQLNMDQKALVGHFQSMGIGDVRNHMSSVETEVVEKLKRLLERQKSTEVVEERIRFGVVKRRTRADEAPSARPSSGGAASSTSTPQSFVSPASSAGARPKAPSSSPPSKRNDEGAEPTTRATGDGARSEEPSSRAGRAEKAAPASSTGVRARPSAKASGVGVPSSAPSETRVNDVDFDEPATVSAPAPIEPSTRTPLRAESSGEPSPPATPSQRRTISQRSDVSGSTGADGTAPVATERSGGANLGSPAEVPERERPSRRGGVGGSAASGAPVPRAEARSVEPRAAVPPPSEPPRSPRPAPASDPPAQAAEGLAGSGAEGAPQRPSSPPRTGIDVWQGRPGVPMPQARAAMLGPQPRRTTYDPRAATAPPRPGQGPVFPGGGRGRPGQRFGFGPGGQRGRIGASSSANRRPVNTPEMAAHKKVIKIDEQVSLQKLAGLMSLKVTDVLMKLLGMGMPGVNINSSIDADTAKILAGEFGWTVEDVAMTEEQTLEAAMGLDDGSEQDVLPRPPIVTVMGHVDHGKTSLLDRIRKASVAQGEAGGITQHIGAYRVETARGTVAFLDTPGHEAFTAMRARGAQVTDIVVLVVAADDGVMPQTREAIAHSQAAKVPIIVAVNKMDKPGAEPEKVQRELSNLGLAPEEWGGETLYCHVSAVTGQGIDELLDAIVLQSEVLELTAAPGRRANGVVIEALLDRGRGPVARVMIQDGTLRAGDIVVAGPAWGKVRAMTDELGRALNAAGPATPVEVLGLNEVPSAGDPFHVVKDAKTAEEIAEGRRKKQNKSLIPQDARVSLDTLTKQLAEGDQLELKLIIKGDVQGSVEAVGASLIKLSTPKVKVTVVHAAVGAITEGDVNLGIASKAIVVGFNVRPAGKAAQLAETGGVEIRLYNIIYNAVDDIKAAMEGLLPTTKLEKALGSAEVRLVFKITKVGAVAGSYVTSGVIKRGCEARLVRDSIVVYTGRVQTLRRIKDDVKEVAEGTECGITLDSYQDLKEGDIIEAFEVEEVKQKLA